MWRVSRKMLNLGILAHVDAGKTTLTERLLYATGVIDELGSVDAGTTQTDSLPLERRRGITIKSAVASFSIGDIVVNLIDTPGHPDFIAEVDRALGVLDGVVLVISAVEGVQPQTRILMRSLRRLKIPALLFVNKIDRRGARDDAMVADVSRQLKVAALAMGSVTAAGTPGAAFTASGAGDAGFAARLAELLAENDEGLLAAYVRDDTDVPYDQLRAALVAQTRRGLVYPAFFGSAITGAGIEPLLAGITELLPATAGDVDGPASGSVFKIERGGGGEKIAYVRMFTGTVRLRDRLRLGAGLEDKVTAVAVFERGATVQRPAVRAGQIGKLWGLAQARIGDRIGYQPGDQTGDRIGYQPGDRTGDRTGDQPGDQPGYQPGDQTGDRIGELAGGGADRQFAPPTLESAVVTRDPSDKQRLRVALGQLAEQDPLINVRQDDERQEIYVSLYGEVQKEVIQSTLAEDFGLAVTFRETTMIYVERPAGGASALEILQSDAHPFSATVGLRFEPGPVGTGVEFRLDCDPRLVPLYIYKTTGNFIDAMTRYVRHALEEGLYGWQVTDCVVTMSDCGYYIGDGPRKRVLPTERTTAADFRKLTPLVLRQALRQAGTVVCEPMARVRLELPAARMGAALSALTRLGAAAQTPLTRGAESVVTATVPSARVRDLQEQLPGLTGGEGVLEASFGGYQPMHGSFPTRSRPAGPGGALVRDLRPCRDGSFGPSCRPRGLVASVYEGDARKRSSVADTDHGRAGRFPDRDRHSRAVGAEHAAMALRSPAAFDRAARRSQPPAKGGPGGPGDADQLRRRTVRAAAGGAFAGVRARGRPAP
jgi:ribosomal protection tetracycline resistance protein